MGPVLFLGDEEPLYILVLREAFVTKDDGWGGIDGTTSTLRSAN